MTVHRGKDSGVKTMRATAIAVALVAFLAFGLSPHFANADGYGNAYDTTQNWHESSFCTSSHRVSQSSSDCLQAWWDNTPSLGSGVAGGSEFWARNLCSNYGSIWAQIDLKNHNDEHFHLSNSATTAGYNWINDVRDIDCCLSKSDLCWLDQVQRYAWDADTNAGKIRHISTNSSGYTTTWVDVSTHEKRYEYCESKPNSVYCRNDPSGDAFTDPNPSCEVTETCNCGDHHCTANDCTSEWDDTAMVERGLFQDARTLNIYGCASSTDSDYGSHFSASIDAADGTSQSCTLQVVCGSNDGANTYENGTWTRTRILKKAQFTADVDDISRHFVCHGVVYEDSCHSGTAVSTHIEDIEITVD